MENKNIRNHTTEMSEDDRLKLAEKLDKDLDEFINNLPKKKYEDGWPEDKWEEEMAKHPFFMKQSPQPGQELHPLYEGLQKLKYDPEENEPHELAVAYKDDGNFNFKHKNYRLAIVAYTEGIKQKCGDPEIDASLLNNRAASHWFLKNYRSCLKDCELALKINPNYEKVINRAAHCCYELKQYEKCIDFCNQILEKQKINGQFLSLRKMCVKEAKLKERNERRREKADRIIKEKEDSLVKEILRRGYKIEGGGYGNLNLSHLEPCFPNLAQNRVFLDEETNSLIWPVVLVYPEYKVMDYIQQFSEKNSIRHQLQVVFETYPDWDEDRKYKPDDLSVYFETEKQKLVKIDTNMSLEEALKIPDYLIKGGTPSFMVLVRDSEAERKLLDK